MHRQKGTVVWIVLLGGAAVLASYTYILCLDSATRTALWGGVPPALLPAYVTSMALAMAGFFAFTYFLLFPTNPDRVRIAGRFGYSLFHGLYFIILIPWALWLPLTSAMVQQASSLGLGHPDLCLFGRAGFCDPVVGLRPCLSAAK